MTPSIADAAVVEAQLPGEFALPGAREVRGAARGDWRRQRPEFEPT